MSALFTSGRVVEIILVVMAVECAVLMLRRPRGHRLDRALDLFLAFAPGACLLLALRAALAGSGWTWVALWLAASFPVHLADLARRRL